MDRTCESLIMMGEVEGLAGFVLKEEEEEDGLVGFVEVGGGMEGGWTDLEAADLPRRTLYSEIGRISFSRSRENELRYVG